MRSRGNRSRDRQKNLNLSRAMTGGQSRRAATVRGNQNMEPKNEFDKQMDHELQQTRQRLFADAFLDSLRKTQPPVAELPVSIANAALAAFDKAFPKTE